MEKKLTCPGCGADGARSAPGRVCVSQDPAIKEDIQSGSFFEWQCSSCSNRYFADEVLLYNDDEKRFMVYFVPGFDGDVLDVPTAVKTDAAYDTENSVLRVAADFVAFTEKIRVLEEGLDDRAIEAIKSIYSAAYAQTCGTDVFDMIFEESDECILTFSVFLEDEDFAVDIPREAYEKTREDFSSLFRDPDEKRFLRIDQQWLKKTLGQS